MQVGRGRTPRSEPRTYPEGVTAWVDVEASDLEATQSFYGGLFGTAVDRAEPNNRHRRR